MYLLFTHPYIITLLTKLGWDGPFSLISRQYKGLRPRTRSVENSTDHRVRVSILFNTSEKQVCTPLKLILEPFHLTFLSINA